MERIQDIVTVFQPYNGIPQSIMVRRLKKGYFYHQVFSNGIGKNLTITTIILCFFAINFQFSLFQDSLFWRERGWGLKVKRGVGGYVKYKNTSVAVLVITCLIV